MKPQKIELKKGDRICFFGDSITQQGLWIAEVFEYFVKCFPEKKIPLFNCGIGGARGYEYNIKNRLYCDCMNYFPTHVVIMHGMNDVYGFLYNPNHPDHDKPELREQQLRLYEESFDPMLRFFLEREIVPIVCTPTPYDEYTKDLPGENDLCDTALKRCAQIARDAAERHGCLLVDMRTALLDRLSQRPVGEDRVHPNAFGYHLMAERFLFTLGLKETEEPDKVVTLSEANRARFETEQKLRLIMGVERDHFRMQYAPSVPIEERKKMVKAALEKGLLPFCAPYPEYADYRDELQGEYLLRTEKMYL